MGYERWISGRSNLLGLDGPELPISRDHGESVPWFMAASGYGMDVRSVEVLGAVIDRDEGSEGSMSSSRTLF